MPSGHSIKPNVVLLFDRDSHTKADDWIPNDAQLTLWVEAALSESMPAALSDDGGDDSDSYGAVAIEVSVSCVSGEKMREMNAQYRDKDKVTNVLSFPADMPILPMEGSESEGILVLGDVIICPEVLTAEAIEQDKSLEHHWAHMVVHSILHLNGLDHEDAVAAEQMESREVEILSKLSIANPYIANSAKKS